MLQKSSREEKLGCLFGLLGGGAGFLIAGQVSGEQGMECGLPIMGPMFLGLFAGGLGGTLFGMTLSHLLPQDASNSSDNKRQIESAAGLGCALLFAGLLLTGAGLLAAVGVIGKTPIPLAWLGVALFIAGCILRRLLPPVQPPLEPVEHRTGESETDEEPSKR